MSQSHCHVNCQLQRLSLVSRVKPQSQASENHVWEQQPGAENDGAPLGRWVGWVPTCQCPGSHIHIPQLPPRSPLHSFMTNLYRDPKRTKTPGMPVFWLKTLRFFQSKENVPPCTSTTPCSFTFISQSPLCQLIIPVPQNLVFLEHVTMHTATRRLQSPPYWHPSKSKAR